MSDLPYSDIYKYSTVHLFVFASCKANCPYLNIEKLGNFKCRVICCDVERLI